MPQEIVRGQVGRANTWSIGQEGGFVAYLRGSIGDRPVFSEAMVLGDVRLLDDSCGRSEAPLLGDGRLGDDVPSRIESTVIMNS